MNYIEKNDAVYRKVEIGNERCDLYSLEDVQRITGTTSDFSHYTLVANVPNRNDTHIIGVVYDSVRSEYVGVFAEPIHESDVLHIVVKIIWIADNLNKYQ